MTTLNEFLGNYESIGWVVEWRHEVVCKSRTDDKKIHSYWTSWAKHWNKKVYETKEIAESAMEGQGTYWLNTEIRYRQIFAKKS